MNKILVTGGAGYIGTHTLIELYSAGYEAVVYDNLDNSSRESLNRVQKITNKKVTFVEGDIRDKSTLSKVFSEHNISSVIHFAGLKAVGESVSEPLKYYDNNVNGTIVLLDVMKEYNCKNIVFSSSATVYGNPETCPILESFPIKATNPYGRTKIFVEEILKDVNESDNFNVMVLRYFNPVGAHESGLIGEDPNGIPNNLMPYIAQVAVQKMEYLNIFGDDYDTPDGTGVRDYIHVSDLAYGHVCALKTMESLKSKFITVNLGTGKGYSVLEVLKAFEDASGKTIPYKIKDRRKGDIAQCYADPSYAYEILGWKASKNLQDMCKDAWNWQSKNPDGFFINNYGKS